MIPDVGADLVELIGATVTDATGGPLVDAGYRVESLLGSGGMAAAFLVRVADDAPPRPGRPIGMSRCVLKVLLPQVVLREARVAELSFKKEVVALSRLAERMPPSPFVVRYLDAGTLAVRTPEATRLGHDPLMLPWCAIELVDGRPLGTTLEERLQNARGPLEPARAAALIDGILRGIRAVHAVGLVHRDLKPSNVLVCGEPPNELPKITDFGVARAAGLGDTFDVTVGTNGYAALEQLEGPSTKGRDLVGPWSDVFALGAILYEILAREMMYEAPTAMGFVGRVLARNVTALASRSDLGEAWQSSEGRALAARWDQVLLRATSPRSPGGGNLGNDARFPLRHRDVEELLDDVDPLLEAMRVLSGRSKLSVTAPNSIARVRESVVAPARWEWAVGPALDAPLLSAACRTDGGILASTGGRLLFWNGERWSDLASRRGDEQIVGVLQGGAGTFVAVRSDGEVEVLPGGGGAFSFRLPFAVKRATAMAGHPLGTAWLVVQAAHGEWSLVRMHGRTGVPFARLGAHAPIAAIVRDELERTIVGGRTVDRRGDEAFLAQIDAQGRATALPPIPGPSVGALAVDADGGLIVAGPGGTARLDPDGKLVPDVLDLSLRERSPDLLVALADGQVWGFSPGVVARRADDGGRWSVLRREPSLESTPVLAAAASGARVWAVHGDGRVLVGRLAIGDGG